MNRWVQRDRAWGEPALKACKQGRPPRPKLNRQQLAQTTRLVRDHAPDQLELPYALWTREAVGQLIQQQWGVRLSQQAVGNYLRAWSLSPQKPTKRAREQCPEVLRNWMEHQYQPCTGGLSGKGPQFTLGDEMGLRSDHQAGTCWAPKGRTPVVETTGQRFGCNLISTLTNRGTLRFQVFEGSFTTEVFLDFLRRLVRSVERKVFLIVDRHSVHRAHRVQQWVANTPRA